MPGIAFTYEMDGNKQITVANERYDIPGPRWQNGTGPLDSNGTFSVPCPFCGASLPNNITRLMRKGYYGAVGWVDYLSGRMIDEVERLGHRNTTVIAIIGDHGCTHSECLDILSNKKQSSPRLSDTQARA